MARPSNCKFGILQVKYAIGIFQSAFQERFRTIRSAYYRGADGLIVVYDITKKESFDRIQMWIEEAFKYSNENPQRMLIGTKSDMNQNRVITTEQAANLAKSLNMQFFETSAMTGDKVVEAFTAMTRVLLAQKKEAAAQEAKNKPADTVKLDQETSLMDKIPCCNKN